MIRHGVELHNVAETTAVGDGERLERVPADVRADLNEGARDNYVRPDGVEIRFVADGPVEVTLSCPAGECEVTPFWGAFRERTTEYVTVGAEPTTIEMEFPNRLAGLDPDAVDGSYHDPAVGRLVLFGDPTLLHGVEGDTRPPRDEELPDRTLLAYGTSITQGAFASRQHLAFPSRTAQHLDADLRNLGTGGSAFCEPEIADHVAARDDWDAAAIEVSVNMLTRDFTAAEFRERATYLLDAVAGENPGKPVAALTLFPMYADLTGEQQDWPATPGDYRAALRDAADAAGHDNLRVVEGTTLLDDPRGLTSDLLHPNDRGMAHIADGLADALD
ncbi:MAG: SGNH/GDSL hydrolase family protein [Halobacteriaceae archaeon]